MVMWPFLEIVRRGVGVEDVALCFLLHQPDVYLDR